MASIKSDKLWADAVRKAVHEYHEAKGEDGKVKKVRYLNLLARTLVKSAASGDITAMKEVGDRLDGKPQQAMQHSGELKVSKVIEEFVLPNGEQYGIEDSDADGVPTAH